MKLKPPPCISTGDTASFAFRTIHFRKPLIIEQVLNGNRISDKYTQNLKDLENEIRRGTITDPFPGIPDNPAVFEKSEIKTWKREIKKHLSKNWFKIPWYFAEAYFYLRLLLAYGYYSPDSGYYIEDPFQHLKDRELHSEKGGIDILSGILNTVSDTAHPEKVLKSVLLFSLWGNRIDLSNYSIAQNSKTDTLRSEDSNILIDNTEQIIDEILKADRIDFLMDNAGQELVCDLSLIRYLFLLRGKNNNLHVTLHVKKAPFFVSDTMKKDVTATVKAFGENKQDSIRETGRVLAQLIADGRIRIEDHFFWNGPLYFTDMPDDLFKSLSNSNFVIIKGDANYRRLLSDRKWNPWEKMKELTEYFPSAFAVLRTMKSEIVTDIDKNVVRNLFAVDKDWMINGKRGIIQLINR